MKALLVCTAFTLLTLSAAKQDSRARAHGAIHGTVIDHDGQFAKNIGLEACPLGVPLGAVLPRTRTNGKGEYRFGDIPWWGMYTVYAEDEETGYSNLSTGRAEPGRLPEVELSQDHPEANLDLRLPAPAGFLRIHLTNRKTGDEIDGVQITVNSAEPTPSFLFSQSCYSNRVILIPPDKDVLIHVTSSGFREWDQSIGRGMPMRIASRSHMRLEVQLEPATTPQ